MVVCSRCGLGNPDGFRFCGGCAAALVAAAEERELRKTVTLLFCDVTGSTALGEQLDPEALRHVMRRYFDEIQAVIERHGGTVEKFVGDAVMAVFGIPAVKEDDALRAVRAAGEIRDRLPAVAAAAGVELVFRTGINTGEVVVGAGHTLATGDAVNVAARLQQAAAPGEIVLGSSTRRLVRDAAAVEALEPILAKGKAEPIAAFRLVDIDPTAPAFARRLDAPLVGRERELRTLTEAFERVLHEGSCQLFTVLGAAGIGKTRLVSAFLERAELQATVVRGRCLHYGEGITFFPLVEALVQLGTPAGPTLERIAGGGSTSPNELFFDVRRVFERVAATRPLVVVVEDLQWAEPMLLDLLDHVAELSRGARLLLVCLGRPELFEERPGWGGGKLNATTMMLEPLAVREREELLDRLGDGLDARSRERIVEASGGNPLFLEEMAALAGELGEVRTPPTIQALLAARLDRLGVDDHAVIARAAVEGEVFHRGAVLELAPDELRPRLDASLAALVRKELIRPEASLLAGDEAFRFRHLLLRDAGYETLPKGTRADLHERFASWLERRGGDLVEADEITGWHLEQAVHYRQDLRLAADAGLSRRAARRLAEAGHRAVARTDTTAGENLLTRAMALLPVGDPARPALALALADAVLLTGQVDRVGALLAEAEADPATRTRAVPARLEWMVHYRPADVPPDAEARLRDALRRFEAEGDERGLARGHLAAACLHTVSNRFAAVGADASLAAVHARRAGDRRLVATALSQRVLAAMIGPDSPAVLYRELASVDSAEGGPEWAAYAVFGLSWLAANEGRLEDARTLLGEATALWDDLGMRIVSLASAQQAGRNTLMAGDPAEAVRVLSHACDELEQLGELSYRSTCRAMLADALYRNDELPLAERAADAAEREGGPGELLNFAITHGVRARIQADRGRLEEAETLARRAVAYALDTDVLETRADAIVALASVLHAAGRVADAAAALHEALALYRQKGNAVRIATTARLLRQLGAEGAVAMPETAP